MINVRSDLTPHTLSSWESYGVWIITFGEKNDMYLTWNSRRHPTPQLYTRLYGVFIISIWEILLFYDEILEYLCFRSKRRNQPPPVHLGSPVVVYHPQPPPLLPLHHAHQKVPSPRNSPLLTSQVQWKIKTTLHSYVLRAMEPRKSHGATSACTVKSLI